MKKKWTDGRTDGLLLHSSFKLHFIFDFVATRISADPDIVLVRAREQEGSRDGWCTVHNTLPGARCTSDLAVARLHLRLSLIDCIILF